jgi:phage FluMu gp28-like protein
MSAKAKSPVKAGSMKQKLQPKAAKVQRTAATLRGASNALPQAGAPARVPSHEDTASRLAGGAPAPLGAPATLLPYQQKWVGEAATTAFWEKSRRVGASWCDAADSVLTAATGEGGMDALYIGYSEDMTREYIDDCAMWAKAFGHAAGSVQETLFVEEGQHGDKNSIKAFRIDFASGNKVLGLSSRPRSIRGKQGKVTIDEAAFHDDLPGLLKAAMAMLIWGGKVRVISSHNGEDNFFNLCVKDIRSGKLPYALHTTTFGQALDDGLYDRVKLMLGARMKEASRAQWEAKVREQYGDDAAEELDVIPKQGSGVYIPRSVVERCQDQAVPVIRLTKPAGYELHDKRLEETDTWLTDTIKPLIDNLPGLRSVYGQDFGRSGDLSDIIILQQHGPGQWQTAFALELRNIPFDVQQKIALFILDNLPLFHHAKFDARGNGQAHAEAALQKFGPARVECVMASPSWYAANFPPYKAALEDRSVTLAPGEDIIADHRRVILKNGYPAMDDGRDKGSDGKPRHGDSAIGYVMAWAATRNEGQPPAGESVAAVNDEIYRPSGMRGRARISMGMNRRQAA